MESTAEHFSAFLFPWFFQGIARAEEQNFCHKTHFFCLLHRKTFAASEQELSNVFYTMYIYYFSIIQCKRFF